ncbi:MAG: flap endonuclease, partial [Actinomycetota bacterium]|nr:flap endonuclease [Actinomycetota bacterium]
GAPASAPKLKVVDDSVTLLVDAPSLFYRALFSTPDTVRTPAGAPINAAHGFFRMLARLVEIHDPHHIACAADENWRPSWRVELIPSYKDVRAAPGSAQEVAEEKLASQVPIIYGLLEKCGIPVIGHADHEAEDVIGTLAHRAPGRTLIFSGDRDLFQLVRDPDIAVLYPIRGVSKVDVVDESYIEARYGIPGRAYRDFAVLRGDPSDGLPGVKGIGEKIAATLVARYGDLGTILAEAEGSAPSVPLAKVKQQADYVRRAATVVTIATDLALKPADLSRQRGLPRTEIIATAERVGLKGPITALLNALS